MKEKTSIIKCEGLEALEEICNKTESNIEFTYMFKFKCYELIIRSNMVVGTKVLSGEFSEVIQEAKLYLNGLLNLPF